jgi:hypothetical protein
MNCEKVRTSEEEHILAPSHSETNLSTVCDHDRMLDSILKCAAPCSWEINVLLVSYMLIS